MKNMVHWVLTLSLAVCLANCGASREQIRTQSKTWCEGIFCEVNHLRRAAPRDLPMWSSRLPSKPICPEKVPCWSLETPPMVGRFYHFIMNIDGQAVTWEVERCAGKLSHSEGPTLPRGG